MKIIGHRGAAGLALENTLPSLELARLLGVDAIEFDVRKTADDQLVLCHDTDLSDVSESGEKVSSLTLKQLQTIILKDEQSTIPTLRAALKMTGNIPVLIEIKQTGCIEALLEVLHDFPSNPVSIVSFKLEELAHLRRLRPDLKLYGLERTKPFDIIQFARELKLDGVGLNFWLLNPLTYWLAKRQKLNVYVYTVNNRLLGRFIGLLYPDVAICTNHPEWFIKHPYLRLRSNRAWATPPNLKKPRKKQKTT
ncbi:glycerophosphodiester phosphodiesterase [Candidatus Saccharibacteria bacterium]|nr:glycerophosphodiester phosphodiesterase [Candidatus Saccharibacteria bacterium]